MSTTSALILLNEPINWFFGVRQTLLMPAKYSQLFFPCDCKRKILLHLISKKHLAQFPRHWNWNDEWFSVMIIIMHQCVLSRSTGSLNYNCSFHVEFTRKLPKWKIEFPKYLTNIKISILFMAVRLWDVRENRYLRKHKNPVSSVFFFFCSLVHE